MKKLMIFAIVAIFLFGFVSSYICVNPQEDNEEVQVFKTKMNLISIKNDLDSGLTYDSITTKLKYFGPCR